MLTKKQQELLLFINERVQQGDVSPSFEEMKKALNLKSKSGIHRLVSALEERGFIRRLPHKARALEILKLPQTTPTQEGRVLNFPEKKAEPNFKKSSAPISTSNLSELPLYGKIAAGTPVEALRNNSDFISVPPELIGRGDHYALTVEGDSMIEAGIHDGDVVIIQRCDSAENGAIVVALVDESEVTLKRMYRQKGEVALEPANRHYQTRVLPSNRVIVQGKLSGLIRRYH